MRHSQLYYRIKVTPDQATFYCSADKREILDETGISKRINYTNPEQIAEWLAERSEEIATFKMKEV
jgi:hypothetical protein